MNVNAVQVSSAARTLLGWVGVWLIGRGYVDESAWSSLSGAFLGIVSALLVIIPFIYGLWVRRTAGLVSTVAKLPEVSTVVTTDKLAAKVDLPGVVTGSMR